jgi:rhamnose utilization protein RhaD (predicted bifunctional aldolase and dehydrogenase)
VLGPLLLDRSSAAVLLAAAAGFAVVILMLVIGVVALGAAFARCAERRRACLQALRILVGAARCQDHRPLRGANRDRRR